MELAALQCAVSLKLEKTLKKTRLISTNIFKIYKQHSTTLTTDLPPESDRKAYLKEGSGFV